MMNRFSLLMLLSVSAVMGCGFTGPSAGGNGNDAMTPDPDGGGGMDGSSACASPIVRGQVQLDGVLVTEPQKPMKTVLLGDTLELSVSGACVQQGDLTLAWSFGPVDPDIGTTAKPSTSASRIEVYPTRAGEYPVTLTVSNGQGGMVQEVVAGFTVASWTALDHFPDPGTRVIQDLSASDDTLWVATTVDAFSVLLDGPELMGDNNYDLVNDTYLGVDLPPNINVVHHDSRNNANFVWFASNTTPDEIYKLVLNAPMPTMVFVGLGADNETSDIASLQPEGVIAGGKLGVFVSPASAVFEADSSERMLDVHAVASTPGKKWAGGSELVELGPELGMITDDKTYSVFSGGDQEIRAILPVDDELWVASKSQGIAHFEPDNPMDKDIYTTSDGLPSNDVRALAVDSRQDIWVATKTGVARYKKDRDVWVSMTLDGLQGREPTAIVVDEKNGRRAIYVGTQSGLLYMHLPQSAP